MSGEKGPIFHIAGVVEGEYKWVIGRCGHVPIKVGDTFTLAIKYRARERLEDFDRTPEIVDRQEVTLQVVLIQAYSKQLPDLGPGMTGSLALKGEGIGRVGEGYVLQTGYEPQAW